MDSDGLLKTQYEIRTKKVCKGLKESVQQKDGKFRTDYQQM
ncbi:unnamed protein product, partial [Rotaria sordida]